jgi:uncharacterized RDD family membrane protein YckC
MKCPKCGYIGFEQTDRCRNCGYDFALAQAAPSDADLSLRNEPAGPFHDFSLRDAAASAETERAGVRRRRPDDEVAGAAGPDLPLFGEGPDELPIVPAAGATPPLAVRRSTPPARPRVRPTPRIVEPTADSGLPLGGEPVTGPTPEGGLPPVVDVGDAVAGHDGPGVLRRLSAALLDWVLLLGADAVVVYFTLRICRLAPAEALVLPPAPLVAFFVLLNGGYMVMLTAAGGQTLGKMAFGLKVVGTDGGRVTVGRALLRAVALLVCTLPAGLGLVPAVFADGHRGLHDWLARTRVVRADS